MIDNHSTQSEIARDNQPILCPHTMPNGIEYRIAKHRPCVIVCRKGNKSHSRAGGNNKKNSRQPAGGVV